MEPNSRKVLSDEIRRPTGLRIRSKGMKIQRYETGIVGLPRAEGPLSGGSGDVRSSSQSKLLLMMVLKVLATQVSLVQ